MSLALLEVFTWSPCFELHNNPMSWWYYQFHFQTGKWWHREVIIQLEVTSLGLTRYLAPKLSLITGTLYCLNPNVYCSFIIHSFKMYYLNTIMF